MKILFENIEIKLPSNLSDDMSEDEFLNFCEQNSDLRIERNAARQIYIMAPVKSLGGKQNASISLELGF